MFNNSLTNLRLLTNEEILLNCNLVQEAFNWVLQVFKKKGKKILYIILAEAPISYSSYFYNPFNEKDSLFITKKMYQLLQKK